MGKTNRWDSEDQSWSPRQRDLEQEEELMGKRRSDRKPNRSTRSPQPENSPTQHASLQ